MNIFDIDRAARACAFRAAVSSCGLATALTLAAAGANAAGEAAPRAGSGPSHGPAAVPAYTPAAFVQGQWSWFYVPQSAAFVQASGALQQALQQHCGGAPKAAAQQRWRDALLAWDKLSAVAVGPLVLRRSARRIDFAPTRPELIQKAVAAFNAAEAKDNEAAMERVGSAARGFAALEWLLWTRPGAKLDPPSCRFAVALAADLASEAAALAGDFQAGAKGFQQAVATGAVAAASSAASGADAPETDKVAEAMSEALNQWTGGLEQMRIQGMERPLHDADNRELAKPQFGRVASGTTQAERQARWSALRGLAVVTGGPAAPPAGKALVSYETYLRGKGEAALADKLAATVKAADTALNDARDNAPAKLRLAARRLVEVTALMQGDVATALDIRIGFSDSDGD